MNLNIRNLEIHDLLFLQDMVYESAFVPKGQKPFPRTILDDPSVARFFNGWGEQCGDIGFIAEISKQPIGAIWLRLFDEDQKGYSSKETPEFGMALIKDFRGHGIGKKLMSVLELQAIECGYNKLCLSVDPRNPARYLYEQFEYVKVDLDNAYWIMEKELV